jgi:hypothetical protein
MGKMKVRGQFHVPAPLITINAEVMFDEIKLTLKVLTIVTYVCMHACMYVYIYFICSIFQDAFQLDYTASNEIIISE